MNRNKTSSVILSNMVMGIHGVMANHPATGEIVHLLAKMDKTFGSGIVVLAPDGDLGNMPIDFGWTDNAVSQTVLCGEDAKKSGIDIFCPLKVDVDGHTLVDMPTLVKMRYTDDNNNWDVISVKAFGSNGKSCTCVFDEKGGVIVGSIDISDEEIPSFIKDLMNTNNAGLAAAKHGNTHERDAAGASA